MGNKGTSCLSDRNLSTNSIARTKTNDSRQGIPPLHSISSVFEMKTSSGSKNYSTVQ